MSLARVELDDGGDTVIVQLQGEIDLSNARGLGDAITGTLSNDALRLVLDLSEVGYLDSAGIQLMYRLREDLRARGQELRLVVPVSSASAAALRLAGVTQHIAPAGTLDEALGRRRAPGD